MLIAVILVVITVACSPVLLLGGWIGDEPAVMVYYLSAFGLAFNIVNSIRKRRLGASNYKFQINSWRLIFPARLLVASRCCTEWSLRFKV